MTDLLSQPPSDNSDLLRRAASDLAHDLNNLRSIVQGNLRLVRQEAKSSGSNAMEESLADVDLAFQGVVSLTQGILALAREAPARAPAPQSLQPVLQKVETLARWALPPQFRITVATPTQECMVFADGDALPAALFRLAMCAKDAAPGGGEVRIAVSEAPANPPPFGRAPRHALACVTIPAKDPGTDGEADSPARRKAALRFEFALALARRAAGQGGDVRLGSTPEGHGSVCLLLPLALPGEKA